MGTGGKGGGKETCWSQTKEKLKFKANQTRGGRIDDEVKLIRKKRKQGAKTKGGLGN